MKRKILPVVICTIFLIPVLKPAYALDYTDAYASYSDAFSSLISPNEGLTVFRSLYIPSGGRAEAMGSAFTALSNDISFFDYNPAASAILENTEAAVSHNAWIADSALETLAFTQRSGTTGYGAALRCFYVPFTEYNIFGERVSRGYYSESIAAINASHTFLSGYDFKGVTVGANIKGGYRSVPDYADNITNEVISGSGLAQSAFTVMGDIGVLLRFNGAKFYSSRDTNINVGFAITNLGAAFTNLGSDSGLQTDSGLPSKAALGLSYKPISPLVLTIEFQQPFNLMDIEKSEQWAAGAGFDLQLTSFFAIQSGFLLKGANPRISLGGEFLVDKFQINVNYTFDLTSSINPINRISLSAKIELGDRGRSKIQEKINTLYNNGLNLYRLGDMQGAIENWQAVLELDSGFDPAKNGIKAASNAIQLQERIIEIQTLD